jgi:riboflavin kinase / FMN adenylyltransferase
MKIHFETPEFSSPSAVAIGTFDGVHLGHRSVISSMQAEAQKSNLKSVVLSFQNHPLSVLAPHRLPPLLSTCQEKTLLLAQLAPENAVLLDFNRAFSELSPESFVRTILVDKLKAKHVTVGFNFRFGHQAQGTPEILKELGQKWGFEVAVHPAFDFSGEAVSSSRIRKLLEQGDLTESNQLLGQAYLIAGPVIRGQGIAAKVLGVPTANIAVDPLQKRLPPNGVYACQAKLPGRTELLPGVLNLGMRPTFSGLTLSLEVYIMDFEGDLYEQEIQIQLLHFIRPEQRFEGPELLKIQIQKDIQRAVELLAQPV